MAIKFLSVRPKHLLPGILVGLVGAVATLLPAGFALQESVDLYVLFQLRGPIPPPPEVVVIAIDEASACVLAIGDACERPIGKPKKPNEWPRSIHADLVRALSKVHPRLIAFDLTFDVASPDPTHDRNLAAAAREAGNVLLVATLARETRESLNGPGGAIGSMMIEQTIPPVLVLEQAALAIGTFPLPKASRVDSYWAFMISSGGQPTLPALALQVYASNAYPDFVVLWADANSNETVRRPEHLVESLYESAAIDRTLLAARRDVLNNPGSASRVAELLQRPGARVVAEGSKRELRALLSLYSGEEMRYLNFYGPPRRILTIPYQDVLRHVVANSGYVPMSNLRQFEDKAVFIGYSASSQPAQDRIRDDYPTVYTGSNELRLSGVELAATAFANLLEDRAIHPLAVPIQVAGLLIAGLLVGAACQVVAPLVATGTLAGLAVAYLGLAVLCFAKSGLFLPIVIPLGLQLPLAVFSGAVLKYRDVRREREAIKKTFGYFLPNSVVDELAAGAGSVAAEKRLVYGACLSTDAENYTALAERTDPQELARLMNRYFAVLFKPVTQRGGIVSDVVGDAMLAVWAASTSDEPLRRNACHAALDLVEAVEEFNRTVASASPLVTRIGLHYGQIAMGTVGAVDHYEYRAVGDIVNAATRIEGLSKRLGTRLLVSEATIANLDEFVIRPVGAFLLAGKSVPLTIVELLGRKEECGQRYEWICKVFARGLSAYQTAQWQSAGAAFRELLSVLPQDGPSRFYLNRCEHLSTTLSVDPWDPTIRIDGR